MRHYQHCGLRIASECAIPELDPVDSGEDVDVRVVLGQAAPGGGDAPTFSASHGECRIWLPEIGHYDVSAGKQIVVRPRSEAEPARVALLLLASPWAALLQQRGSFALHAGVTSDGDEAIAFCGPQGAGKSSTVAKLVDEGQSLVSDDLTRLEVGDDGPPLVWPSAPRLKLSPEAVVAGGRSSQGATERPMPDGKRHVRWAGARARGPVALRAIYVLAWGEPRETRLRGRKAVEALAASATYRPQLLESPAASARHWRQCVAIAQRIPVFEFSRPRDWTSMLPAAAPRS